ncbi:MAG TPA: ThuA domain-containing protein [Terriglobia bacterium]|nr:ThuA domain-containing protein [Terriglobia bacterium]
MRLQAVASGVRLVWALAVILVSGGLSVHAAGIEFKGTSGPGKGKHVVLIAADDEYHSEEALPQLAKILSKRHGFTCTVLFAINPNDGTIDPHERHNIPGLEALQSADLLILFARFRDLPDSQMKYIADYVDSGRPIIGIRTATHAFDIKPGSTYSRYSFNSRIQGWEGGFGRRVLGETWVAHHGDHGKQSTRGIIVKGEEHNPILRGIEDGAIWTPTDVYEVRLPLRANCHPLILGEALTNMNPNYPPAPGKVNDPMMPVAWTCAYTGSQGRTARVFTSTMGAADDLENEALRRLLVNATYWAVGLENKIPPKADVDLVGEYHPHPFTSDEHIKGVRPSDLVK